MKKLLLFLFCLTSIVHILAQSSIEVSFSVKGVDGQPLPATDTYARSMSIYRAGNRFPLMSPWVNDATFSVQLSAGQYTYELTANGNYPAFRGTFTVNDTPLPVEISYENYSLTTFNITHETSENVPNADISVFSPTGDLLVRKITDSEGKMLVYLPDGTHNYDIERNNYVLKSGQLSVSGAPSTLSVNYANYYPVTFSAKNQSNEGISRLNLTIYNTENSSVYTSDIDETGIHVVYMEAKSYRYLTAPLDNGSFYTDKTGTVTVSGAQTIGLTYDYHKITFIIENAGGTRQDDMNTIITSLNEVPRRIQTVYQTTNPGEYITYLPNGDYLYEIGRNLGGTDEVNLNAPFSVNNADVNINITLYQVPFRITGIGDEGIQSDVLIYDQNNKKVAQKETAFDGKVDLYLPTGNYTYAVRSDGYDPQKGSITVSTTNLEQLVSFSTRKKVTFRLKNTENENISNQEVAIYQSDKFVAKASSNEQGEAVLYLTEGTYTYDISMAKGYQLALNTNNQEVNITLAKLTFNVTDKENTPINSLQINIIDQYNNVVYFNPYSYGTSEYYIKNGDYRYMVSFQDGINYPEKTGEFTISDVSKKIDIDFDDCNKVEFIINNPGDVESFSIRISDGQSTVMEAETYGDGKATLYLPDGNYQYDVYRGPDIYSGLTGYVPSSGTLVVEGAPQSKQISFDNYHEITFNMQKKDNGVVVSDDNFQIRILDQNGKEIEGWGTSSKYTIMMTAGNYRYEAFGGQYAKKTSDFTVANADQSINIIFEDYYKVTFEITSTSDMPESSPNIRIFNSVNNELLKDNDNGDGTSTVYLPDGTYIYDISGSQLPKQTGTFSVSGSDITVPVSYNPLYPVTFNVKDASGKKINGIGGRIFDENKNELYNILPGSFDYYIEGDSHDYPEDENSPYLNNILMLPNGTYTYEVFTDKLAKKTGTVTVSGPTEVNISYVGSGIAIFTANDINGKKLPLINISLKSGADVVASYETDYFGQAVFYLSEGSYSYTAQGPGYVTRSGKVEIKGDEARIDLLFADVTVAGKITSIGVTVPSATVLVYPLNDDSGKIIAGEPINIETMSDGSFSKVISAGKYYFYAEATGYLPAYFNPSGSVSGWKEATMLNLKENNLAINIQLGQIPDDIESGDITIEGSVYDAVDIERGSLKARVAMNSTVGIYRSTKSAQKADDWVLVKTVRPDVNGNYRFTNLPEGVYRVVVDIPGYTFDANSVEIDARSGQTYTINDFIVNDETMTITQDGTSSVTVPDDIQWMVYPNPVTDVVYIEGPEGEYTVKVINMAGKTLLTKKESAAKAIINLSNQPPGIYLLKIEKQGSTMTRKLIKK
ncbi:MAG: T9SS type A sorting domain-containing protein [Bacteroidales bacterium]|jgi:hypothetical protein|nr:T9SS type A sorting domain-containing protein [Bacteroidales bacterium]